MNVVVSDTNIFIDLDQIGLLEAFCELSCDIHTVDFVLAELTKGILRDKVERLVSAHKIHLKVYDGNELMKLAGYYASIKERCNLSLTDCSVLTYAQDNGFKLLTGDRKLKRHAEVNGLDVSGVLFVMDALLEEHILSIEVYKEKLSRLMLTNERLPRREIEIRLHRD